MQDRFTAFIHNLLEKSKDPAPVAALQVCGVCMFGTERHSQTAYWNLYSNKDRESKKITGDPWKTSVQQNT
jgi:hypothetical protein